jgi:DNA processing protein
MAQHSSSQAIHYNALAIKYNSNFSALNKIYDRHGDWEIAFKKDDYHEASPERLYQELIDRDIKLAINGEVEFPNLLKEIPYPPLGLYYKGSLDCLNQKCLAIVGTRKASKLSIVASEQISKNLSKLGITIVSGLALGVDGAAHKGALLEKSKTVAVLACGLDKVYPSKNSNLAKAILENEGALVSEYPIESSPLKNFFIARNRIISGLSQATLVIEAPQKSGALATARFCVEQNRDLYVLPGSHKDKSFYGSNKLIQDGATLLMDYREIALDFGVNIEDREVDNRNLKFDKLSEMQTIIVNALENLAGPSAIDEIAEKSKLDIATLQTNLTQLILDGLVFEDQGKYQLK